MRRARGLEQRRVLDELGKRIVRMLVRIGRERGERLELADRRAAIRRLPHHMRACQRSIASASCGRRSSTEAKGAKMRLCVESSHETSRRKLRDALRRQHPAGDQRLVQRGKTRRAEALALDAREQVGEQCEIVLGRFDAVQHRSIDRFQIDANATAIAIHASSHPDQTSSKYTAAASATVTAALTPHSGPSGAGKF